MMYPSLTLQGTLFNHELIKHLPENGYMGQQPEDFQLSSGLALLDEIGHHWDGTRHAWSGFTRRLQHTTADRKRQQTVLEVWLKPLLLSLGASLVERPIEHINGSAYPISHAIDHPEGLPVHVVPYGQSLDEKSSRGGFRGSAHALVQEYLNQKEEYLFALITNGQQLRLVRDATRLSKQSYVEFDLELMMQEEGEHYADFAIMYRLLHASRFQAPPDDPAKCWLEKYHQESLSSGERIRSSLSHTIKGGLRSIGQGLMENPHNTELQAWAEKGPHQAHEFYLLLLRIMYRLLFLIVTEERDLIFPASSPTDAEQARHRTRYLHHYSIRRIRALANRFSEVGPHHHDLWEAVKTTFSLFEEDEKAAKVGLKALGGELFGPKSLGKLRNTRLNNGPLIKFLHDLSHFTNEQGIVQRVNYADLGTEELGSIYEELLDDAPHFVHDAQTGGLTLKWESATARRKTGSHYTQDDLIKPLFSHSLEKALTDIEQLANTDPEAAIRRIRGLRILDPACGSGHILIKVARRLGMALAQLIEQTDNPSASKLRLYTREIIRSCLYGVDKNHMAVELCKVALWLEAHEPGLPLNFLDHRIRQGDSLVGLHHLQELTQLLPQEAFKKRKGDDNATLKLLRKQNKDGIANRYQLNIFEKEANPYISEKYHDVINLPEETVAEVAEKQEAYTAFKESTGYQYYAYLANLQLSVWYGKRTPETKPSIITNESYFDLLRSPNKIPEGIGVERAKTIAEENAFFHWFLEYPDVAQAGGFDLIVGNPPFLGGLKLSTYFGDRYMNYLHKAYAPASGTADLVAFFFRRSYSLLKPDSFLSFISTNTVAQGDTREGGLAILLKDGACIPFAIRSKKWPGAAAVEVSLVTLYKGHWEGKASLDGKEVEVINSYLDDSEPLPPPQRLKANEGLSFIGSYILGDGFLMSPEEAQAWIDKDPKNKDVLFPYLNGKDLNSRPDQSPSRWVINFHDWPLNEEQDWEEARKKNPKKPEEALKGPPYASDYPELLAIVEARVKPERQRWRKDKNGQPIIGDYAVLKHRAIKWWQFGARSGTLYEKLDQMKIAQSYPRVICIPRVSKDLQICYSNVNSVFSDALVVILPNEKINVGVLGSSIHQYWAWSQASTLGSGIRYSPTDCFETFPFPKKCEAIDGAFSELVSFKQKVSIESGLGLTNLTNGVHANTMDATFPQFYALQIQLDQIVLEAYGWHQDSDAGPAILLDHDFYPQDYISSQDNIRFTISPLAQKQVLERLIKLNHKRTPR